MRNLCQQDLPITPNMQITLTLFYFVFDNNTQQTNMYMYRICVFVFSIYLFGNSNWNPSFINSNAESWTKERIKYIFGIVSNQLVEECLRWMIKHIMQLNMKNGCNIVSICSFCLPLSNRMFLICVFRSIGVHYFRF